MACVFRRKAKWTDKDGLTQAAKTSTYYARFDVGGKQYCLSTGKTTKPEAEQELKKLVALKRGEVRVEDELKTLRGLLQSPAAVDETEENRTDSRRNFLVNHFEPLLLDLIQGLPELERETHRRQLAKKLLIGQSRKLRIEDGWKEWENSPNKKRTPKAATIDGYTAIWKRFKAWAPSKSLEYFHEVLEQHAKDYAQDLWSSKISPSTFNAHIKFLMSIFGLLETNAGLTENVWRRITRKEKAPDQGRRNFTEEELRKILANATGPMRVMFAIGLFTGLRLGDVVNLRFDEIDNDRYSLDRGPKPGFLVVKPMKTSRKGKTVQVPIHPVLRRVLDEHKKTVKGDYLFPDERKAYELHTANISKPIQDFFESCGIKTNEEPGNTERRRAIVRVGFHSLRFSFVSLAAKSGAPQHVVQQLVGHGSPAMTEHYTRLDDQQKQEAVAKLPEFVTSNGTTA